MRREVALLATVSVVVTLAVRLFVAQAFVIPSGSMEPLLEPGDRVLVSRAEYWRGPVRRGDVVVFDGRGYFTASAPPATSSLVGAAGRVGDWFGVSPFERDFVKRVVGLPGERVACCDPQGRLTVDGESLGEPYTYPGEDPSALEFDVLVPGDRLWLMGDHRSDSADSRAHLGDPGGGMVPVERVVGRVVAVAWPPGRATGVGRVGYAGDASSQGLPGSGRQEGITAWAW